MKQGKVLLWSFAALMLFSVGLICPAQSASRSKGTKRGLTQNETPQIHDSAGQSAGKDKGDSREFLELLETTRKDSQLSESLWDVPPILAGGVIPIPTTPPGGTTPGRDGDTPSAPRSSGWTCSASCNSVQIDRTVDCGDRLTGEGAGSSQEEACRNAKRAAVSSAPRGCFGRHCRCLRCG